VVDGKEYRNDIVLWPGGILESWWRKEGHLLRKEDLEELLHREFELLIVGTGFHGAMRVEENLLKDLRSRGWDVEVMKTTEACKAYNAASSERKTAAALHLTC